MTTAMLASQAEAQTFDYCLGASPDVGYNVWDDFIDTEGFRMDRPSDEAIYYYSGDYGGRLCEYWIMDIYVSTQSNWCDPPSTYTCGVYIGDDGWDVPSSMLTCGESYCWDRPTRERDCVTYLRRGKRYKQPYGGSLAFQAGWTVTGDWIGNICYLSDPAAAHYLAIKTTGVGWDRYRIASSLSVRGSGQQTDVYIATPGPP